MGGENEKVVLKKETETIRAGQTTTVQSPNAGKIRIHNNTGEGKVHFHDDAAKLKVAIPTGDYWKRYNDWKINPERPLQFVDPDHNAELIIVARRVMKDPPEIDADISIKALTVGANFKQLEDFVNSR